MTDLFTIQHLSSSLDDAERLFVEGKHGLCFQTTRSIINDLCVLTSIPTQTQSPKRSKLSLQFDQHLCADGCLCRASVALCVQCLFEMHRFSLIDDLLLTYYDSFETIPYDVFVLWVQFKLERKEYEIVASTIVKYLESEKDITVRRQQRLNTEQYSALIELLVFHTLVPLNSAQEGVLFLQNNTRLPDWKRQVCVRES